MASYETNNDIVGGGYGFGGGGGLAMVLVILVVLWTLFRDGHKDGYDGGHRGYGYGDGCGCGPCVRPSFIDESNFEEERNINSKLCKVDEDVWKNGCKDREATHCEGEKTRALIEQNYIQDLRDKLTESQMCNMTLKQEMFTDKKFDQVFNQFCKTDAAIAALACELPKRPPVWAETITPDTHHTDCDHRRDSGRRGRCNDWDDGCCA